MITAFTGAQFVATQAGMNTKAGGDLNYIQALLMGLVISTTYTLGGLVNVRHEDWSTYLMTAMTLLTNFICWASCTNGMLSYKIHDKVGASTCALMIIITSFVPAVYFLYKDSQIWGWNYLPYSSYLIGYNTAMLITAIVVAVIGTALLVMTVGHLLYIWHKCRVWGRKK